MRDLRTTFDEDAARYDRARPGYPPALVHDLVDLTGIGPGSRVVEIGPGTGQGTATLVAAGAEVVAVELGANLAAVLRANLAGTPLDVVVEAFEEWPIPTNGFDAVVAFTSWHWLDPAIRTTKVAALLRPGGVIATVSTEHVAGGSTELFDELQHCYEQWDPATPPGLRLRAADDIAPMLDEIDRSTDFQPAIRRRFQQGITYSTNEYLDLLNTYSGHRALGRTQREGLFDCIARHIDDEPSQTMTKRYLYELRVAARR